MHHFITQKTLDFQCACIFDFFEPNFKVASCVRLLWVMLTWMCVWCITSYSLFSAINTPSFLNNNIWFVSITYPPIRFKLLEMNFKIRCDFVKSWLLEHGAETMSYAALSMLRRANFMPPTHYHHRHHRRRRVFLSKEKNRPRSSAWNIYGAIVIVWLGRLSIPYRLRKNLFVERTNWIRTSKCYESPWI